MRNSFPATATVIGRSWINSKEGLTFSQIELVSHWQGLIFVANHQWVQVRTAVPLRQSPQKNPTATFCIRDCHVISAVEGEMGSSLSNVPTATTKLEAQTKLWPSERFSSDNENVRWGTLLVATMDQIRWKLINRPTVATNNSITLR